MFEGARCLLFSPLMQTRAFFAPLIAALGLVVCGAWACSGGRGSSPGDSLDDEGAGGAGDVSAFTSSCTSLMTDAGEPVPCEGVPMVSGDREPSVLLSP